MNEVKFYLKDKNTKRKSLIYALFYTGENRHLKLSTKLNVEPKYWNPIKQQAKQGYTFQFELNQNLRAFAEKLQQIYFDLKISSGNSSVTPEMMKNALSVNYSVNSSRKSALIPMYQEFMKEKSRTLESSSTQTMVTTLSHLKGFEKKSGKVLTVEDVSKQFYDNFTNYLFDEKKHNPNTVGKNVKNLKTFLNTLKVKGEVDESVIQCFKVTKVQADKIALSENDISKIAAYDFEDNDKLTRTRDAFLFQCFTAIRISDLKQLSQENLDSEYNTFHYIQQKSKERVVLPFTSPIIRLISSYPDLNFRVVSEQKFNDYIKDVAKIAGLSEEVSVIGWVGRKKMTYNKPKYELITSHTGRRTFATFCLRKGMRPEVVMRFTGHKTLQSFWSYIKITPAEYQQELLDAWGE